MSAQIEWNPWWTSQYQSTIEEVEPRQQTSSPSSDGLFELSDRHNSLISIYASLDGRPMVEMGDVVRPIAGSEVIELAGELWQLRLDKVADEAGPAPKPFRVESMRLHIHANKAWTSIRLAIEEGGRRIDIAPRVDHELLLVLARQWHDDALAGHEEDECGWIDRDELSKRMARPVRQLNVQVHRLRAQFRQHGVVAADDIIERRRFPSEVRIGVRNTVLEGYARRS